MSTIIVPWKIFEDFLPPLSSSERERLEESIKKYGIREPIKIRPDGHIIDGLHRWQIAEDLGINCPYKIEELKEDEAFDLGLSLNMARRHLSTEQLKGITSKLRAQRKTQQQVAKITGVPQQTISRWEDEKITDTQTGISPKIDLRVKLPKGSRSTIYERSKTGETQKSIAADYKVDQSRISGIIKEQKKKDHKEDQKILMKISDFKCGVEWADYQINIYTGCSHDCVYCYAKIMNKRYNWTTNWAEPSQRQIDLEHLAKTLTKIDKGTFMFCSTTDAYQPLNNELNWAKQVLEVLLKSNHHTVILTKSANVEKDLDLLVKHDNVELGFTIVCLDDDANKKYEPHSSSPSERVNVLKKAHELGIKTLVSIEPWILGHTDPIAIVTELRDHVDRWIFGTHNYFTSKIIDYQPYIGELHSFLIQNKINFRMKAELDRAFKSSPLIPRSEFIGSKQQLVGLE